MKILIGLGNIGSKYHNTRHNAGFMALDYLVEHLEKEHGITIEWKEDPKLKAYTAKVPHHGKVIFLAKPTTLMNLSGHSVSAILNFFKEPVENLIVIYDDIDLPLGTVRTRESGSAGTHNGMKSIITQLATQDFKRIRIGIESRGAESPMQQDLSSFVLSPFQESEYPKLRESFQKVASELDSLLP